ncbi:MAG: hypothetical protein HY721_11220, partial [Planctomycetes bacterium]|nr:hypothetical protein [Planctomycetota bacterium]
MAHHRRRLAGALAGIWVAAGSLPAVELTLGFEGCPEEVSGSPGEVRTFDVFATLTTEANDSPDGAQAWFIVLEATGGEVKGFSFDGIAVSTVFDHDGDPSTPDLDPYELDLGSAAHTGVNEWYPTCVPLPHAVVILSFDPTMTLQPTGTQRIARITVEAKVPVLESAAPLSLRYAVLGGQGGGACGPPPYSSITLGGDSFWPVSTTECKVVLRHARFRRGDANADGQVDISDPIFTLLYLF